jgi:hypothetical protein
MSLGWSPANCYVADFETGAAPTDMEGACGWLKRETDSPFAQRWEKGSASSRRIGWTDQTYLYLNPTESLLAARAVSEGFATSRLALGKQLEDSGRLALLDSRSDRTRRTARVICQNKRQNVWVIRASHFWPDADTEEEP